MQIYSRLAICAVVIGIISGVFVAFRFGSDAPNVLLEAKRYVEITNDLFELVISHSSALFLIFLSGLCVFGWLTVLPILFFRTYSLSFGLFSVFLLNGKEAAVIIPPLLIPFILEISSMLFFTPISTEFSLSLSSTSKPRFFSRLMFYILFFIFAGVFVCLSACCDMLIAKYL